MIVIRHAPPSGKMGTIPIFCLSRAKHFYCCQENHREEVTCLRYSRLTVFVGCGDSLAEQLRDGDIIFQTSRSELSIPIQKATHSQYSHMGIVFFRNGSPYVYEAINTVVGAQVENTSHDEV